MSKLLGLIRSHFMIAGGIIIGIGIAVALIIVIVKFIKKKKKAAGPAKEKMSFLKNPFKKSFKIFRKHLPWRLRMALTYRKHFLYLNCADDDLIKKCTDVEHYAYEYYPEYRADGDCNFHITSKIFINEIKQGLILDNSEYTTLKLRRFWRKVFYHQKPVVIVSVDYRQIISQPNENIMELQMAVRKKLDMVSKLLGKPVRVYFTLANLHTEEGYNCFTQFLEDNNLNYYSAIDEGESLPAEFSASFKQYCESLSGLMISSDSAPETVRAIRCMSTIGKIKDRLGVWLEKITFNDGILVSPVIRGMILATYRKDLNPFALLYTKPKLNYHRRNMIFSFIGLIIIGLMVKSAFLTYQIVSDDKKELLQAMNNNKSAKSTEEFSQKITEDGIKLVENTEQELGKSFWTSVFPASYVVLPLKRDIANHIYETILQPELMKTTSAENTIFYLFLIRSDLDSSLRRYMLNQSNKISSALNIDQKVIEYFITYNGKKRKYNFTGTTAYPNISDYYFGDQYRYLIDLYTKLSQSNNISINDLNQFLKYFYSYYNKKIAIDLLLNKYYPKIKNSLKPETKQFINKYQTFLNERIIRNREASRLIKDIDVFQKTKYKIPTNLTFYELLKTINRIAGDALGDDTPKTISLKSPSGQINLRSWEQVVAVAKINSLLKNFFAGGKSQGDLFSDNFKKLFLPISINPDNRGQFLYVGKYQVPGIYTKLAVNSAVIPTVKQYKAMIKKIKRLGIKTDYLEYSFDRKLRDYVDDYKNSYIKLINNFSCEVKSPTELKLFLKNYSSPESPLLMLINIVKNNTQFEIGDNNKFIQPVVTKFEAYTKLKEKPKKDTIDSGSLETYMSIIENAVSEVAGPVKVPGKTKLTTAQIELSKLGSMAMKIAINGKDSYLNIVVAWLKNINMPEDLRGPFLKPIEEIYVFGSADLRKKLNSVWNQQMQPLVNKYKLFYPFDKDAKKNFDTEAFIEDFGTKGNFWNTFNLYFKPFMELVNGKWQRKSMLLNVPLISKNALLQIDKVESLTEKLFDKNGSPKPLKIKIAPEPIYEFKGDDDTVIQLTSLDSGDQEVIGINSVPVWTDFSIKWWDPLVSQVSIQMSDGSTYNTDQVEGVFSFFRLLGDAEYDKEKGVFTWTINILGEEIRKAKVSFKFKTDPRKAFSL